jgi:hypothetical protein
MMRRESGDGCLLSWLAISSSNIKYSKLSKMDRTNSSIMKLCYSSNFVIMQNILLSGQRKELAKINITCSPFETYTRVFYRCSKQNFRLMRYVC